MITKNSIFNLLLRYGLILAVFLLSTFSVTARKVRYLVKIKSGQGNPFAQKIQQRSNLSSLSSELNHGDSQSLKHESLAHLGVMMVEGEQDQVEDMLVDHPLVEYVEENIEWELQDTRNCNSNDVSPASRECAPWLEHVLGLNQDVHDSHPALSQSIQAGDEPVVVAVVDTGAKVTHPYLQPAIAVNELERDGVAGVDDDGNGVIDDIHGFNAITGSGDVEEILTDHGSHVSGLVKVVRDQALAMGYTQARKVQILPVRFIGAFSGSTFDAVRAIDYSLSRGAKVINASWGATGFGAYSKILYDSLKRAYHSDVIVTIAAGNYATDNDSVPFFPSSFNLPSLISVGSVTPHYRPGSFVPAAEDLLATSVSDFSNVGERSVHIFAPGDYVDPLVEFGVDISGSWSPFSDSDHLIRKRGTSMATPVVAGTAAVVRAINPSLTAFEAAQLVINEGFSASEYAQSISNKVLDSASAFAAAEVAVTTGTNPGVAANCVNAFSSFRCVESSSSTGGCATVDGGSSQGPLGGNSLFLFTLVYLVSLLFKRAKSEIKSSLSFSKKALFIFR